MGEVYYSVVHGNGYYHEDDDRNYYDGDNAEDEDDCSPYYEGDGDDDNHSRQSCQEAKVTLTLPPESTKVAPLESACSRCVVGMILARILKQLMQLKNRIMICKNGCLLYTSPSPRDRQKSRMPSSA